MSESEPRPPVLCYARKPPVRRKPLGPPVPANRFLRWWRRNVVPLGVLWTIVAMVAPRGPFSSFRHDPWQVAAVVLVVGLPVYVIASFALCLRYAKPAARTRGR